jgi:NAD(P)H-hydrate epimerase
MKLFSAAQIREGDLYTIKHEPISSSALMERAARRCASAVLDELTPIKKLVMICGPGNNGGDGLVMARVLKPHVGQIAVICVGKEEKRSPDFVHQFSLLIDSGVQPIVISEEYALQDLKKEISGPDTLIGDALFGTGLSKPLKTGLFAETVHAMNESGCPIFSVDIPSGLAADEPFENSAVVKARITFSFEQPKRSFLFAENEQFTGALRVLPIGINQQFKEDTSTPHFLITLEGVAELKRKISPFSHKGTFGHAALVAGSYGKAGASHLSASACLRSGAGLTTLFTPSDLIPFVQTALPEVMAETAGSGKWIAPFRFDADRFSALGIGPGLGTAQETASAVKNMLAEFGGPLVLDADALNILSENKTWLSFLPANQTVLTPHPKEFDRLTKVHTTGFERWKTQVDFSQKYSCYVVLKGRYTSVTTPTGKTFFNTSGNPGMAKGGSGDVLTGLLTGLAAQDIPLVVAILQGVYLHGLAGDLAASELGREGVTAGDIIRYIPAAFQTVFT